jgi:hypothetical protein
MTSRYHLGPSFLAEAVGIFGTVRYQDVFHPQTFVGLNACNLLKKEMVAHTGLEPVISALRGQRVNQLHQCAASRMKNPLVVL